jgi:hypothetical protein
MHAYEFQEFASAWWLSYKKDSVNIELHITNSYKHIGETSSYIYTIYFCKTKFICSYVMKMGDHRDKIKLLR